MFPEIEGGTQMQPKKIGGTWGKSLRTPGLDVKSAVTRRLLPSVEIYKGIVFQASYGKLALRFSTA